MKLILAIACGLLLLALALFPAGIAQADGDVSIDSARVFHSYAEANDWMILVRYNNSDSDYAPYTDPSETWALQLRDDTGTVVAQYPIRMWGIRPGSIYISATEASALEWGNADYSVVMHATYNASFDYTFNLSATDWRGSSMSQLDSFCVYSAKLMAAEDSTTYTISTAEFGDVLNAEGGSIFIRGIPGLDVIRPELFFVTETIIGEWETDDFTHSYADTLSDYESALGTQLAAILTDQEEITNLSGRWLGGLIVFAVFVIVSGFGVRVGHFGGGLAVGSLVLLTGVLIGLIPMAALFVVLGLGLLVFVKATIWDRGAS